MKLNKLIAGLVAVILIASTLMIPALADYAPYKEAFVQDAIDGTTRWMAPLKNGSSYYFATITSKWNEQRAVSGTSPHIGVDVSISQTNKVVAVIAGNLKKDTSADGKLFNTITLNTNHSSKNVYCHYEHCATIMPDDYYNVGDQVGEGGEYGSPKQPHLHFGAYDTGNTSTRKAYRNETLYRNSGNTWNSGRNCDTFSMVGWLNDTTAQVTLVFSGTGNPHNEKPSAAQIYYRVHGTAKWLGPYNMTNSGLTDDFNYAYNFKSLVTSGTEIDWVVRYRRTSPSSYMWAPAKYYNPAADPNSTTDYAWPYVKSIVRY